MLLEKFCIKHSIAFCQLEFLNDSTEWLNTLKLDASHSVANMILNIADFSRKVNYNHSA